MDLPMCPGGKVSAGAGARRGSEEEEREAYLHFCDDSRGAFHLESGQLPSWAALSLMIDAMSLGGGGTIPDLV